MSNHIHTEIKDISPEWAKEKLDEHTKRVDAGDFRQRGISKLVVRKYTADMKNGNWLVNGQALQWDEDGNLIDGQHRLWAVYRSGVTVQMMVVTNLPRNSQNGSKIKTMDTIDIGRGRNLAQQLSIDGVPYAHLRASTARCLAMLSSGLQKRVISAPQGWAILNLFERHLDPVHTGLVGENFQALHNARGWFMAPLLLLRCQDQDTVDVFVKEYVEMTNLKKGSPVLALTKFINRPGMSIRGSDSQLDCMTGVATALWHYTNNKPIEFLRGDKQSVEWLLNTCKTQVKKVNAIIGDDLSVDDLRK